MSQTIVLRENTDVSAPPKAIPLTRPKVTAPVFTEQQTVIQDSSLGSEVEWMRNKVGPDSVIRILASGDIGPKEIGKVIKLLEAQKLVLEDD